MPGLIGFVSDLEIDKIDSLLTGMARAMKNKDWYQVDLHSDEGIGLGRVSTGLLNPEPQPIWNDDKTICIVMEGELFDYQTLKQELITKGYKFKLHNDVEFMLHLFQEYGDDFAIYLNGVFVAAIWNKREKKLLLVNDRLGTRPLYYASYNGHFAFASGVRALLADPALSRKIDPVAISQMLSFEYVLGNRTLLSEVNLLPPASLLTLSKANFTVRSYWKMQYPDVYQLRSSEEYLEGLIYYMRQAVRRQMPGNIPAGLNLSGGLDSRMLLGLLGEEESKIPVQTFTFGVHGSSDVRFARELAGVAGTPHQYYELRPDYLLDLAEEGVRLTDGLESCYHMHALANLKDQAKQVRLLYTGFLIDFLISPDIERVWLANYDDNTVREFIFNDINVLFKSTNKEDLFTKNFLHLIDGDFEQDFNNRIAESKSSNLADWRDRFDFYQRQRRFTKQGDELLRSQVICRTPFSDNDLIDFALTIPPGLRLDRALFKQALAKLFFDLAKVPWDKTGFPLVPCAREVYLRVEQQARWQLRKYGFSWIFDRRRHHYAKYDSWFRNELQVWLEEILLSKQALERGYFNASFIRNLISLHMAGNDYSAELGVLLTLELWHRQFID